MNSGQGDTAPSLDLSLQRKARSYANRSRTLYFIDILIGASVLAGFAFSGISRLFRDNVSMPGPLSAFVLLIAMALTYGVLSSPPAYYRSFTLPHRYGLATHRFGIWLLDRAKRGILVIVFGGAVVAFSYWAMEAFPAIWWLMAGCLVLSITVVLNILAPVVIVPLFFKCAPLRDGELSRRLVDLAHRSGTEILGIFTVDQWRGSTAANAMLMGLGRTRRIIMSSGLSHTYSPDEIEAILAHELGHHLHHDIPRLIALKAFIGLAGFFLGNIMLRALAGRLGLGGISDIAGLPFLVLILMAFSLAAGPLTSAYIRNLERHADACALSLTGNPDAFVSLMTKLANQNLNEANPSRWAELLFYDHPPYYKRVAQAMKHQREPC